MTTLVQGFEGHTPGQTITPANSGGASGDAWTLTASIAGGTCTASPAWSAHGGLSMEVTTGATAGAERRGWAVNPTDSTNPQHLRFYVDPANQIGTTSPARGMNATSSGQRWRIQLTAAGVLTLINNGTTVLWTSTPLAAGTTWRVEATVGGNAPSTTARVHIYAGDSTTPAQDSGTLTGVNLGGPTREIWFGQTNSAANVRTRLDDCAWSDEAPLGPALVDPDPTVARGPVAGALDHQGVTVAYELDDAAGLPVRLVVSTDPTLTAPTYSAPATVDGDGTVKLTAAGLPPLTVHHYGVEVDGLLLDTGRGTVTTHPTPGAQASFSLAITSCQIGGADTATYTAIAAHPTEHPLLGLAHGGDLGYPDWTGTPGQPVVAAYMWAQLGQPSMAACLAAVALRLLVNNHDWAADPSDRLSPAGPDVAAAYRQVIPHLALPAADGRGVWFSEVIGRVRLIYLDMRTQRDPQTDPDGPGKSMLGVDQLAWLLDELGQPEPLKILFSDPWRGQGASGGRWGAYAHEFGLVNDAIDADPDCRVYVASGDRHALGADDGTSAGTRGRPNALAAPANQGSEEPHETWSHGYYYGAADGANLDAYGVLDVTDAGDTITVAFGGWTADGVRRVSMSTAYDLTPPEPPGPPAPGVLTPALAGGSTITPALGGGSTITPTTAP